MDIRTRFEAYVSDNQLFEKGDKILLAVSGGKDSMLMLWLFMACGFDVVVAHCNFQLRGEESDADEALVRNYTKRWGLPLHVKAFPTETWAQEHKTSIQVAARELRYAWFKALAKDLNCAYIAVAQHKNDHIETVLWNLTRGTGLLGLQGILNKRDAIIRPLLFLSRDEISTAMSTYGIPYRDDSSNFSTKYSRNKIRLDIIPRFEELNPNFLSVMEANIARFQESMQVLKGFVDPLRSQYFIPLGPELWQIKQENLQLLDMGLLYLLFEPYGYAKNVLHDLVKGLQQQESGRVFESEEYQLLLDREYVYLRKKELPQLAEAEILEDTKGLDFGGYSFSFSWPSDLSIEKDLAVVKVDSSKLIFPLRLRYWKLGDTFHPLGMKGQKKVSDLFIQKKINRFEKDRTPILVNGDGEIIWVVGLQLGDAYKITENSQKVLRLVFRK
ncbi:tRNA lysidine(34) synthetase TilS [Sphingobacterium sp. Mn56C]|uniref:tRNA lysidine(34) synthetase TilS n=1 Tax=Sphingobacterium sp. Mn56C TaxID=3395261 RepID=UPI003BCD0869